MALNQLPISRLVSVAVNLAPNAAQAQNLNTLLVLGSSAVIDTNERFRTYYSLDAVASDFGTTTAEYNSAKLYFSQTPQPSQLQIGRWVKTASSGGLKCATISAATQAIATWNAITTGSFRVAVNGAGATNITGLNFSAAANLQAVAAIIQAALAGTTVVWNPTFQRFEFTSTTTGATSAVSFLSAAGSGTDISALIGGLSTTSGAYVFAGQAAETAVAAATLFDANFGQSWYGLFMPEAVNADHLAVAGYIEATNTKHLYFVNTQEAGVLVAADTTNIAYQLKALGYNRSFTQYSSGSLYAVASAAARMLTVDYTGNNTVIALMYKQEPGVTSEALNATQVNALEAFNCNVFVAYNNNTSIVERGAMASGIRSDVITGTDWFAVTLQTALYNVLYTSTTKIPQTDAGMNVLTTTAEAICRQAVINGFVAPGIWSTGGFGLLKQGAYLETGFYVYAPPVATQNASDRAARKSVPIQVALKLAGAVETIAVTVNVNQ